MQEKAIPAGTTIYSSYKLGRDRQNSQPEQHRKIPATSKRQHSLLLTVKNTLVGEFWNDQD